MNEYYYIYSYIYFHIFIPCIEKLYFHYMFLFHYITISFQIEWDMIVVTVFLLNFERNGFIFCSKSKGRLSPRSYPMQCERKWEYSFLSVPLLQVGKN